MPDLRGVVFQVIDRQDGVEGIVPTKLGAVEGALGEGAQGEGRQGAGAQGEGKQGKEAKAESAQEEGTVKVVRITGAGLD